MKKALKIILICVLCLGLLGGGVFAYLKFRKVPPCEVYPAMQWMMSYMPNQTYLYGIVTSDASQIVSKDPDRTVLEILVHPGDVVSIGDPLLRYDATRTNLSYEQSMLDLVKLENKLRAAYAEYKKYAREDYEEPILTPTPRPTPIVRTGSAGAAAGRIARLSLRVVSDLVTPLEGAGTQDEPFLYEIGAEDPVTDTFFRTLLDTAAEREEAVFARILQPEAEILIAAQPDGTFSFSVTVSGPPAWRIVPFFMKKNFSPRAMAWLMS